MKGAIMIIVVLAAFAVASAGSVDIKVQDKTIAITPTEDAWQQLVAPLSEVLASLMHVAHCRAGLV
jgi:hypothetical protein